MKQLGFSGACGLAREIARGTLSAVECLTEFRKRVERFNPALNAVVVLDWERAFGRARTLDHAQARGAPLGPFHGVPMTVKESFDLANQPTTWGDPALCSKMATKDDVAVARLEDAGAIVFGKTNVPFRLRDFQTHNDIYGVTNNPWDLTRTPGGSSGGSAAALAAGLTGMELGSDLGGSVRQPAHACGVFGHKPTFNLVMTGGTTAPGAPGPTDMAVAGPLARRAEDLETAMSVLAGSRVMTTKTDKPLRSHRVCLWFQQPGFDVDTEIQDQCQHVADVLSQQGVTVSDRARPNFNAQDAHLLFVELLEATTHPMEARRNALEAQRARLQQQWDAFFVDWDVVVAPVAPTAAQPHSTTPLLERNVVVNGRTQHMSNAFFWPGLASAAYLPSTAFPVGRTRAGLPVGLQALAQRNQDLVGIRFCRMFSDVTAGFVAPPGWD